MKILSNLSLLIEFIYLYQISGLKMNMDIHASTSAATTSTQVIIPPSKVPIISSISSYSEINNSNKHFLPFDSLQAHDINEELRQNAVLTISSYLPKFDSVGHNILSANYKFIYSILHNDLLTPELKKMIILDSIKLAQMGDDFGSQILQMYYNLVDKFL